MKPTRLLLVSGTALLLAACDFVRFPGDGGPSPETPAIDPAVPPGAPGPPPPAAPVEDPYDADTDTDTADVDGESPEAPDTSDEDEGSADPVSDPADTDTPDTDINLDADPDTDGNSVDEEPSDPVETDSDTNPIDETPSEPTQSAEPIEPVEPPAPVEPVFSYFQPGALLPGSGQGAPDQIVYAPDMVFPIAEAPTYLQSQVFSFGGGVAGGDQCDARNYDYPWRDNFCETRSANRGSPYCPQNKIHQGQDIRVGTAADCNTLRRTAADDRMLHRVVAVEDGVISYVGTYSVNLRAGGRIYKYMHMNMDQLQVKAGDPVTAGQHIGYVSNDFGGTATTFHLHFEITQNSGDGQWAHVPPFLSLVTAYERRENGPGEMIEPGNVAVASTPFVIPEGMIITE